MNKRLTNKIDKWLSEKRKSRGGYAEITDNDVSDFGAIIRDLIYAKCEPDPDDDYPIQFALVNRRTRFWPVIPYSVAYKPSFSDLRILTIDIQVLSHIVEREITEMQVRENELFNSSDTPNPVDRQ